MDAPEVHDAMKGERAMRRRRYELAETRRWVHHVADLDSGEIVTTPLDRPVTPLSRAERLSQLGHRLDPAMFGGPAQRLTPRHHYQSSPDAWLSATRCDSYSPVGETDGVIWWVLPQEFDPSVNFGMYFFFGSPPVGLTLASVTVGGYAFEGAQGSVTLNAYGTQGPGSLTVPVTRSFGVHTIDFTFVPPPPPQHLDIVMRFNQGIEEMAFEMISLAAAPPWIDTGPTGPVVFG